MTESAFWSMIRSATKTKRVDGGNQFLNVKLLQGELIKERNKRQKWEYQCNKCKSWFKK